MDLATGLLALGSAKLAERILGPTFDYVGSGLKDYAEKSVHNIGRVLANAGERLGPKIEDPGSVPAKVLRRLLSEAAFCEDGITAEYLGGVLASSRSGVSRDDRGGYYVQLIGRLSTYQVRAHYIFYQLTKDIFDGRNLSPNAPLHRNLMRVYVPLDEFIAAMDFCEDEQVSPITSHIVGGLLKESLIQYFRVGDVESIRDEFEYSKGAFGKDYTERKAYLRERISQGGIVFEPSPEGTELFLWAFGKGDTSVADFLLPENKFRVDSAVVLPKKCQEVKPITTNTVTTAARSYRKRD